MLYNLSLLETDQLHQLFVKLSSQWLLAMRPDLMTKTEKEKHEELLAIVKELETRQFSPEFKTVPLSQNE